MYGCFDVSKLFNEGNLLAGALTRRSVRYKLLEPSSKRIVVFRSQPGRLPQFRPTRRMPRR